MRDHAAKCVETFETSHGRGKRRLETTESDEEEYSSMSGEEKGVVPKLRERHRSDYKQQHTLGHGQLSPNQDTATGVPSVKSQQIKESNEGSMNIEMTAADDEYSQTSSNEISSHLSKRQRRESDIYAPKQRILHSAKYKAQERNHPKVGKGKSGRYLEHTTACLSEKQVWSDEEDTQQSPYTSSKSVRAETDPEEASFSSSEGEEESQHSGPETGGWKRASTRSEVRTTDRDSEKGTEKCTKEEHEPSKQDRGFQNAEQVTTKTIVLMLIRLLKEGGNKSSKLENVTLQSVKEKCNVRLVFWASRGCLQQVGIGRVLLQTQILTPTVAQTRDNAHLQWRAEKEEKVSVEHM